MSIKKLLLSLAALGLLAVSYHAARPGHGFPGIADRDLGGNAGKGN